MNEYGQFTTGQWTFVHWTWDLIQKVGVGGSGSQTSRRLGSGKLSMKLPAKLQYLAKGSCKKGLHLVFVLKFKVRRHDNDGTLC